MALKTMAGLDPTLRLTNTQCQDATLLTSPFLIVVRGKAAGVAANRGPKPRASPPSRSELGPKRAAGKILPGCHETALHRRVIVQPSQLNVGDPGRASHEDTVRQKHDIEVACMSSKQTVKTVHV